MKKETSSEKEEASFLLHFSENVISVFSHLEQDHP